MDPAKILLLKDQLNKKQVRLLQHGQHLHSRPANKVLGGEDIMGSRLDRVICWSNLFGFRHGAINFSREKQ